MLSGSYTTTTHSNIYSHHLHPKRHVFNPLKSSAVTQQEEQVFNVASGPNKMASCTDQRFLYTVFVAIRLATNHHSS